MTDHISPLIDLLRGLKTLTAVGVLARVALSLDRAVNPASRAVVEDEIALRREILSVARAEVGVSPDDDSPDAIEKIGDFIDREADRLLEGRQAASQVCC